MLQLIFALIWGRKGKQNGDLHSPDTHPASGRLSKAQRPWVGVGGGGPTKQEGSQFRQTEPPIQTTDRNANLPLRKYSRRAYLLFLGAPTLRLRLEKMKSME